MKHKDFIGIEGARAAVIGASEGIGAEIAVALGLAGAEVTLGGRSRERLAKTMSRIEDGGGSGSVREINARHPESVQAFASAVMGSDPTPTILVNSMGGTLMKPAESVEVSEWDTIFETHVRGTFLACQAFGQTMKEHGYGKIINLSSTLAFTVTAGANISVYAAAKAAVSQLTAALAVEWAPAGVRVNALAPTATKTPRVVDRIAEDEDWERHLVQRIPLGRLAETKDMVGPALFLASPMSDFVTGHTLMVDGGWLPAK